MVQKRGTTRGASSSKPQEHAPRPPPERASKQAIARAEALVRSLIERTLIQPSQARNVSKSTVLWNEVIDAIRSGEKVHPLLANFVARCLELCIADPVHAGQHMGLIKGRGRKPKDDLYWQLAVRVSQCRAEGMPITYAGRKIDKQGADEIVAREFGVHRDEVLRAWRRFGKQAGRRFKSVCMSLPTSLMAAEESAALHRKWQEIFGSTE